MTNKIRKTISIDQNLEQPLANFSGSINELLKSLSANKIAVDFIKAKGDFNLGEIVRLGLEAKAELIKSELIKQRSYAELFGKAAAKPESKINLSPAVREALEVIGFDTYDELVAYIYGQYPHLEGSLSEEALRRNRDVYGNLPQYYTNQFLNQFGYRLSRNELTRI